jgi:hypothetical protein
VPNNEFGDFQTPPPLAALMLNSLPRRAWARIIEPTCGVGNVLREAAARFPGAYAVGIEIQTRHVAAARAIGLRVVAADFFTYPWKKIGGPRGPLLVVGNPPWVTNADLGRWAARNRPARSNVHGAAGLAAMTGASNFDIAEFIWQKLLHELRGTEATIALLCKTQVARSVLEWCARERMPVVAASVRRVDTRRWFGVSVDAGLFAVEVGAGAAPGGYTCDVYDSLDATRPDHRFGVVGGRLVADLDAYAAGAAVDGVCPVEWRQGLKHDAARVMEVCGPVDVEEDYVFPLLKGADLGHGRLEPGRWVIVPQRRLGDDTERLRVDAPRLWRYLEAHAAVLDARRSSIYRNRPRFCVFGVGPYAFAPYKIAVSGLHKTVEFRLVGPAHGRPVLVDDTCYLLPFDDAVEAAAVAALLRSPPVGGFFRALAFPAAKRPVTKRLLQRIDLAAVVGRLGRADVQHAIVEHLAAIGAAAAPAVIDETIDRLVAGWAGAGPRSIMTRSVPVQKDLAASREL